MNGNDEPMDETRKKHLESAKQIVANCMFDETALSAQAAKACELVGQVFRDATEALVVVAPRNERLGMALQLLEEACFWTKSSIRMHDELSKKAVDDAANKAFKETQESLENGTPSNN